MIILKKQTKLTKKQLLLKKQKQRHYITAAILAVAIVLVGVFFYTLKPSSTVQIELQIEPETPQQSENNTTIIYPGLISAVAQCILNGSVHEFNATSIIESIKKTNIDIYILTATFQFPDSFSNSVMDRKIVLIFNVSLSNNVSVCVNNFCSPDELNSPIEQMTINGSTIQIDLKYNITHVVIQTPIPARRNEE